MIINMLQTLFFVLEMGNNNSDHCNVLVNQRITALTVLKKDMFMGL